MTLMKPPPSPLPLRILTHNIRYATTSPFRGEEPWPIRLPRLLSCLRFHTQHIPTAIICLQEVLHSQLLDLLSGLNHPTPSSPLDTPQWASIGVGRDDGLHAGEYSPILYRPAVFSLHSSRTLWLSKTPLIPGSKSWDASLPRILTIAVLQHRASNRPIVVMNTHLDDQGARSRAEAARMIVAEVGLTGQDGTPRPVLLAGDFNSEDDGMAYRVITAGESPLGDLRDEIAPRERYGHENTYTGFGYEDEKRPTRIDFLFADRRGKGEGVRGAAEREGAGLGVGREGPWKVDGYGVLENRFEDGVVVSDHRAVVADVTLL